MIDRYTRPEMGHIFSLQNKFEVWKEIEILACEAQAELGKAGITKEEAAWIRAHADFTVERIDEIEQVTNHDVIAFLTNMAEYIDADIPEGSEPPSRWVHYGMTSSDLGDTALCYQITQAIDIILADIAKLGETCKRRAFEFKDTLCVGRTHGIHAEPMTFGMKFGSWAWALKRALTRLEQARGELKLCEVLVEVMAVVVNTELVFQLLIGGGERNVPQLRKTARHGHRNRAIHMEMQVYQAVLGDGGNRRAHGVLSFKGLLLHRTPKRFPSQRLRIACWGCTHPRVE